MFDKNTYENICPVASQPSKLNGTPKLCKYFTNVPSPRPFASSVNSFNCNLPRYISKLLQPKVSRFRSTQDTFTFIKELEKIRDYSSFTVSFDVSNIFPNIPLNEIIESDLY